MIQQYSTWKKVDLHIHTDLSRETKENDYKGDFSVDLLKHKLKENEVAIFSMTDHNIINLQAYKEYYDSYDPEEDPLLLLGVELDINVANGDSNKTYHSLLIFNYSTSENAEEIHNKLEEKYAQKGDERKARVLTINDIVELFPYDDFFFIPHAGNTKSIVDAYKTNIADAQQMVLLMQCAFEKVKEKARQHYNIGFDKTLAEAFRNREDYAYIEFSDNHNVNAYPCAGKGDDGREHDFYYIKGSKSFETLRLAFVDPHSRIKSGDDFRQLGGGKKYIESVKLNSSDLTKETTIHFSPHLNVIIGGRSSGKSLMMSILGNKTGCRNVDSQKYNLDYGIFEIKTNLDSDYQQVASLSNDDIVYIKQGDIIRYFEEKKLSELAYESGKKAEYDSSKFDFQEHARNLDRGIESLQSAYGECLDDAGHRHVIHAPTMDSFLSDSFILKIDCQSVLNTNDISEQVDRAQHILEEIIENVSEFKSSEIYDLSPSELVTVTRFEDLIQEKSTLINHKKEISDRKIGFINSANRVVEEKNRMLDQESRLRIDAGAEIAQVKKNIAKRFENYRKLKLSCYNLEFFETKLTKEISINEDVSLALEVNTDIPSKIKESVLDGINGSDITLSIYVNIIGVIDKRKTIKNYPIATPENLRKKISKSLEQLIDNIKNPNDYLKYRSGETSNSNSPGYNSEKYLELILKSEKSKVIFIDQPEDNLGNKFISNELVNIIREIKFEKQVFLITHNPSIVVYGDAENIVLAYNTDGKIEYKQAVLEDIDSQKEICHILDGGEYVFDMRAKKYNIKRILLER